MFQIQIGNWNHIYISVLAWKTRQQINRLFELLYLFILIYSWRCQTGEEEPNVQPVRRQCTMQRRSSVMQGASTRLASSAVSRPALPQQRVSWWIWRIMQICDRSNLHVTPPPPSYFPPSIHLCVSHLGLHHYSAVPLYFSVFNDLPAKLLWFFHPASVWLACWFHTATSA